MRITEKLKKLLSVALAIVMVLSSVPATARAEGSDGICDCGTDDESIHATTCAVYVAPEDPVCYCAEKCSEPNIWCDVCGFDVTGCTGTDTAAVYADEGYTYDEATNTYTVRTADALNTAISNAGTSGTTDNPAIIKLAADVEVAGTPNEFGDVEQALLVDKGVITLDLNGHTVTSTGEAYYVIQVDNGATLTIDDSSEGNQGKIKDVHTAVQCYNGELVINGGTFEGVDSVSGWNDVTIIINGGTFIATQNAILAGNSVLTITGGTFTGGRSALSLTEWGTYSITGGSFSGEKYDIDTGGATRFLSYNEGTGVGPTFPGGLSIWTNEYTGLNLNALLAEYAAYYDANVEKIDLDDSAASYDGDVTVECEHLAEENADTNCQGSPCKYCGRYFGYKNFNNHVSNEVTYTPNVEDSSKHDKKYVCCGTVDVTEDHTGGTATSCTTQANCEYCGASYGEVDTTNHDSTVAFDSNGFCPNGCYEPAVLNGDVYEISNAGQLYWFAEHVNAGNTGTNAKLTADIDLENRSWEPIASYSGTFDGGNYSITNLNVNAAASNAGLFGSVSGTVKDLSVSGSVTVSANDVMGVGVIGVLKNGGVARGITSRVNITVNSGITGTCYVGGVVGTLWGTVTECAYYGNISLGDAAVDQTGGIAAYVEYTATAPAITNCGFYGSITTSNTANSIGGILGYSRNSRLTLESCLSVGDLPDSGSAVTAFGVINAAPASIMGLYYLEGSAPNATANSGSYSYTPADGSITAATADQLKSGEVAHLLGSAWGQTIGTDDYPVLGGAAVYYGYTSCAEDAEMVYTNDPSASATRPGHSTEVEDDKAANCTSKAYCSVCESYYGEVDLTKHNETVAYENGFCPNGCYEPAEDSDSDGYYEIGNAGQLYWFAAQVNGGNTAINAILTKDITVNENVLNEDGTLNGDGSNFRVWTPIGNYDYPYTGTFNGNGKTVSGLYFNDSSTDDVGLFGYVRSGTINHVGVINSYFNGHYYVGGVAGFSGGTVKNCYNTSTVSGDMKVDGIVGSPLGKVVNCFNLDTCGMTAVGTYKTAEQFASGEVAYLLNGSTSEGELVWKQTIGTDIYPSFTGGTVYYGYTSCAEDAEMVYTNDPSVSATRPAHSTGADGDKAANCTSKAYCSVCDSEYGEVNVDNHNYDNGFCIRCDAYEPAVLNGDVYEISNAGQLYWFAVQVNGGSNGINGKLTNDIVVNEGVLDEMAKDTPDTSSFRTWNTSSVNYAGTFDGGEHTVSGLYFDDSKTGEVGMFGRLAGGTVENLTVSDSYFRGNQFVGGIVGWNAGTVSNCGYDGIVIGEVIVGGMAGYNLGTVKNCVSEGSVTAAYTGSGKAGGITGENDGTVESCTNNAAVTTGNSSGGLVGENSGVVTNCVNTGTVSGSCNVGGIVGYDWNGSVTDCRNTGTVSAGPMANGDPGGQAGGVVGGNYTESTITNCWNSGSVTATGDGNYNIGGVAGSNFGTVKDCYNTGNISGAECVGGVVGSNSSTLASSYSTGTVTCSDGVGGVVGDNWPNGTVTDCYYLDTTATGGIYGSDAEGQAEAKTEAQFKSGEVAYLLQGERATIVWGQEIGNENTPVLGGKEVYCGYTSCGDDGMVYTNDDSAVSAEKPGHTHGTPSYRWTEDPICLTVSVSCTACGESLSGYTTEMDVTTSEDGLTTTYTATVTLDGKDYTDYRTFTNDVTSVSITWGTLEFTYTEESGWNNPDTAWVQVENTGNTSVSVTYTYETDRTDITGSFDDGTSTVTELAIDAANTKKIWLRLEGTPSEALSNTKIGSVKLTIE